jgi:hypothetical protein
VRLTRRLGMSVKRGKTPPRSRVNESSALAVALLEERGLSLPRRPRGKVPELKDPLTDYGDQELMELLVEHSQWTSYLTTMLSVAEIEEEAAEEVARQTLTEILISLEPAYSKETMTERKARASLREDVKEAQKIHREARAYRKLLLGVAEAAERRASNVSREITRRSERDGPDRRTARWSP